MSFLLEYRTKRKVFNNIEEAIEVAKSLPEGKCRIMDAETKKQIWERSND